MYPCDMIEINFSVKYDDVRRGLMIELHAQECHKLLYYIVLINNGNCTEWSAIWSEIKRVITKSHNHEAAVLTLL